MRAPVMAALSDRLDAVADAVPREAPIIYFDVPVHFNIGDLLILAGTETWLKRHGRRVTHRFSVRDYRRFLQSVTEDHVLLFHGGGNMGDLWREHEALRQDVLRRFPRNKAVLLPQTVHFRNAQAAKACGAAYREHADCTVFVRDDTSRRLVEEQMGVACTVAPDMAHVLWHSGALIPQGKGGEGELCIRRTDQEASPGQPFEGIDWHDTLTLNDRILFRLLSRAMHLNRSGAFQRSLMNAWSLLRGQAVARATTLLDRHASILSDRLHAAILGCLLGKEVTIVDNSYGKLSSYFDTWMPGMIPRAGACALDPRL